MMLTALVNMQQDARAEVKGYEPMEVCCWCIRSKTDTDAPCSHAC